MATDFDNLVADLERSYEELQARMSDPSVYNDHREAADIGRRLKELERRLKQIERSRWWRLRPRPPRLPHRRSSVRRP